MVWSSINETSTLSVTPALNSNPLSIAFNAGSKLKQLIDFGIIELRANPAYSPEATRIYECVPPDDATALRATPTRRRKYHDVQPCYPALAAPFPVSLALRVDVGIYLHLLCVVHA